MTVPPHRLIHDYRSGVVLFRLSAYDWRVGAWDASRELLLPPIPAEIGPRRVGVPIVVGRVAEAARYVDPVPKFADRAHRLFILLVLDIELLQASFDVAPGRAER